MSTGLAIVVVAVAFILGRLTSGRLVLMRHLQEQRKETQMLQDALNSTTGSLHEAGCLIDLLRREAPAASQDRDSSLQGVVMPVIPVPSPPLTVREPVVWGDKPEGWGHHLCTHCRQAAKNGMHIRTSLQRCDPARTGQPYGLVAHPPGTACPTNCAGSVDS